MGEQRVIDQTSQRPATAASLTSDLRGLGDLAGATVLIHSSLSALGFVCGGPQAVVEALLAAVGSSGTLVMPTHSAHLSDPAAWRNPAVPETWWATIRANMPIFDAATTPTREMGAVVEVFRDHPAARRSSHPQTSFAALGPQAARMCGEHQLPHRLGERSPLERLYEAGGWVLLLGVDHSVNTSLHLAEYRSPQAACRHVGNRIPVGYGVGGTDWVEVDDVDIDAGDFAEIGSAYEAAKPDAVRVGTVGQATARMLPMPPLVDFAVGWMAEHR